MTDQEPEDIVVSRVEDDEISRINVEKLAALSNPKEDPPWEMEDTRPITNDQVFRADRFNGEKLGVYAHFVNMDAKSWTRQQHLDRIAFLYHKQHTEPPVLVLDVGVPSLGYVPDWAILDGNHRFVALLCLPEDERPDFVLATVSGAVDVIEELSI